jgi:hypothetical protein
MLGVWDRFERWAQRYKRSCAREISRMCRKGYADGPILFLLKHYEVQSDPVMDLDLGEDELNKRIDSRIAFFRGYLVDISYDGPAFMSRQSRFLTLQYPRRCENAVGVWLEEDTKGEVEPWGYHGFRSFDVSFFVNSIEGVDLASMRGVLPFKWMYLRKPKGQAWTQKECRKLERRLDYDLRFDGYEHDLRMKKNGEFLTLTFKWLKND